VSVLEPSYALKIADRAQLLEQAQTAFDQVWRVDFSAPGFCVIDTGSEIDSRTVRAWMVELKKDCAKSAPSAEPARSAICRWGDSINRLPRSFTAMALPKNLY